MPAKIVLHGTHETTERCGKWTVGEVDMHVAGRTIHFDLCEAHAAELEAVDVKVTRWTDL